MEAFNAGQYKKGHRQSAESRDKMSLAKIGHTPWNKGKVGVMKAWNKGKKFSDESKKKMSESHKGQIAWNKGLGTKTSDSKKIRMSKEYKEWRKTVFLRDDFICQDCGVRGNRLHPDHIFPFAYFPEQRFLVENGQTLCEDCHRKTPTYGRKSDDYAEFDFCPTYLIDILTSNSRVATC